jgi:hypothetical protein
MNKKAQDVEAIHILMKGILLLIIVGVFTLFIYMSHTGTRSVTPAQAEIIAYRLLSDPEGIIYEEQGRRYPGIIDQEKFKEERLEQTINYSYGPKPGIKLTLHIDGQAEQTIFLNQAQYRRLLPAAGVLGLGRAYSLQKKIPLLVHKENELHRAVLDMHIVAVRQ